ncbi:MAG TPA: response regulator transcription factor [Kiritimatiellia bacterium]|nr:response regulator transcription factor [Kiritimatiellia bacterium]
MHILVIEDNPALRRSLAQWLAENGYTVRTAATLAAATAHLAATPVEIVLLDLGLPDGDGLAWLQALRLQQPALPVIILTARDSVTDRVRGLDEGADDYLVKPFDFSELLARIRARQRRSEPAGAGALRVGDLEIDPLQRSVRRGTRLVECTPREFDVLLMLARQPGQIVSRERLAAEVWKVHNRMTSMDNVIDVLMSRLREKIDRDEPARLIHTIRGLGFMLKGEP